MTEYACTPPTAMSCRRVPGMCIYVTGGAALIADQCFARSSPKDLVTLSVKAVAVDLRDLDVSTINPDEDCCYESTLTLERGLRGATGTRSNPAGFHCSWPLSFNPGPKMRVRRLWPLVRTANGRKFSWLAMTPRTPKLAGGPSVRPSKGIISASLLRGRPES